MKVTKAVIPAAGLGTRVLPASKAVPKEMLNTRAGAFVAIHEHGKLRGCIGTTGPTTKCVAQEIIQNAISASTKGPRFNPITEEELPCLDISVDVLGDAEEIDSPTELDVKRYGVIVTKGFRRGLLLPDLEADRSNLSPHLLFFWLCFQALSQLGQWHQAFPFLP